MKIGEVILNKLLKNYNQDMIDNMNSLPLCPSAFGYKLEECLGKCNDCYNLSSNMFKTNKSEDYYYMYAFLRPLCKSNDIEFEPIDVFKHLI